MLHVLVYFAVPSFCSVIWLTGISTCGGLGCALL